MDPFALLELIALEADQVDQSFEFWLTASFAVVVAAHAGRESMRRAHRHLLGGIYVLFCLGTFIKFWADVESITYYHGFLQATEFSIDRISNGASMAARVLIYLVGSVSVTAFVYWSGVWSIPERES